MKLRRIASLLALCLVAGALLAPAGVEAKGKKKKAPSKVVVGTDPADDWGAGVDAALQPIGDGLGQELVEATIEMGEKGMINFIIKVNSLPPNGGVPEMTRYTWDFQVGKEHLELDGKWLNYTRGACDPTSGQCPPPRDPGMQPFLLRGNCRVESVGINLTVCDELAKIQGIFDPAEGTITIPVPMDALKAKSGIKISGVAGTFGGTISAAPSAFITNNAMPMDLLTTTKVFVVP